MRCFLAFDLSPAEVLSIDNWRTRAFPDHSSAVPAANFHITLSFIGDIKPSQHETIILAMEKLIANTVGPAPLHLDAFRFFPKEGFGWLQSTTPNKSWMNWFADTRSCLNGLHMSTNAHKPYQPHLTIFREHTSTMPAPLMQPDFRVSPKSLTLYESLKTGKVRHSIYQAMASWDLNFFDRPKQCD